MAIRLFRPPFSHGLATILLLWLLCWDATLLDAYTPIYSVKTNVGLASLSPTGAISSATVTGLNNSNAVAGYVGYSVRSRSFTSNYTNAFVWDDAAQTLVGFNNLTASSSSMATCANDAGFVAGVCWTQGVASQQLGFVYQAGNVSTFQSPEGGDIDTVVGVNASGQVIATYYGDSGYIRAFLWDGTNSTDLGDFGDPDESYVWPQGINDNGQVIGTVYIVGAGSPQSTLPSTAFLWQNGAMSAVDGADAFNDTVAQAINVAGESIGSYPVPSLVRQGEYTTGGFYGYDNLATDLGSLSKGSTVPFYIDSTGNVYGVSNAADGSLHLFAWQYGTLTDLGSATLTGGDTNFQMTSVNALGDIAGFVTDASGATQPFLQTQSTNYNLIALMPSSLGFSATSANGSLLVVNEAELVAAAGSSQGQPVVLLLTQDADGNGLPDGWEVQYFGQTLGTGATALAANGSGLTILQCYQQGINPNDFYNGQAPILTIVSGNNQTASPDGMVPQALVVSVTDASGAALFNAPVTFTVTSGGGQLQSSSSGAPSTSVVIPTNYFGQATVYFQLPNTASSTSIVTASAGTGSSANQILFTEQSDDGTGAFSSPFGPSNVIVTLNSDGSADISWVNNTDSTANIPIRLKQKDGTWKLMATVPAGTTSVHIPAP